VAASVPQLAMSEDNIFREVDEELRREQLAAMWDKYGIFVIIGAVLIVTIVGGYNAYNWWEAKRAAENGQAYYEAGQLVGEKKDTEALDAYSKLATHSGDGYRSLAHLEMAGLELRQGNRAAAIELYDKVANGGADQLLRDFAKLQAAALRLDDTDESEMKKRLDGLNTDTNPWRYSARELLALAAFRSGNTAESEKLFSQLLSDPSSPAEIRRRAEAMLGLLVKGSKKVSSVPETGQTSRTQ
jgi:hypothetical protein